MLFWIQAWRLSLHQGPFLCSWAAFPGDWVSLKHGSTSPQYPSRFHKFRRWAPSAPTSRNSQSIQGPKPIRSVVRLAFLFFSLETTCPAGFFKALRSYLPSKTLRDPSRGHIHILSVFSGEHLNTSSHPRGIPLPSRTNNGQLDTEDSM